MKSVCVFCGANAGGSPAFAEAARQLGEALADRSLALVYGGSSIGLMGILADTVLSKGGKAYGVLPDFMGKLELGHPGLTELELVGSMHERKASMAARAGAFAALPGGFGTLDELFEILTWAQLGLHRKPIGILNVDGYYDGLLAFLDHAAGQRLLKEEHRAMVIVERDAGRLLDRFAAYTPPVVDKWIKPSQT